MSQVTFAPPQPVLRVNSLPIRRDSNGTAVELTDGRCLTRETRAFASGGYAEVYKGTWCPSANHASIPVAIKVLRVSGTNENSDDYESILTRVDKRLGREMYCWQRLSHRRITPLLAYGPRSAKVTREEMPVLISPYRKNGDLRIFTRKNPHKDRLILLQQAAEGLAYLHACQPQIIHMDIKPENILINDTEEAELCDFGLAKALEGVPSGFTTSNRLAGTTAYMAPELLNPPDDDDDDDNSLQPPPEVQVPPVKTAAADVYGFGCAILEVMSGTAPFHKLPLAMIIVQVMAGKKPTRKAHPIDCPPPVAEELWKLMHRCWDRDPVQRISAEQIYHKLGEIRQMKMMIEGYGSNM